MYIHLRYRVASMSRDEIYHELNQEINYLSRHECTRRVMVRTDYLLDQLVELQHLEAMELLEEEANEPMIISEGII